jgi:hypothetical protein
LFFRMQICENGKILYTTSSYNWNFQG